MKALPFFAVILLAGCSAPPPADDYGMKWQKLADGSQVSTWSTSMNDQDPRALRTGEVVRCWPQSGKFDCLAAHTSSVTGYDFERQVVAALPKEWKTPPSGYRCISSVKIDYREDRVSADGKMVQNDIVSKNVDKPHWPAKDIIAVMKKEQASDTLYFDCPAVLKAMRDGGGEKALLDGEKALQSATLAYGTVMVAN